MSGRLRNVLLGAWKEVLGRAGDQPALLDEKGKVQRTFHDVEARAGELEELLRDLRRRQMVAIQIGNHVDWPSLLLACWRRDLIVLPLERGMTRHERDTALRICGASAVVVALPDGGIEILKAEKPPGIAATTGMSATVLLKLTSGTTAAPRAICFRSGQLLADCQQICETMGITERDVNFGVIPVSHSYGFSNLITPLLACGVPMALSEDRIPRAVLENLDGSGATVFPGMPVFYQAFCEMTEPPPLKRLRLCISAGAPLPAELARKFLRKFGQPIHSFYGSSECGGICYDRDGSATLSGFVGTAMCGVKLEFLEPDAGSSRIRVCSAAVGEGYFPEPEPDKLGSGCFIPDDVIAQNEAGLSIVGRVSDVINVAGKKVNPAEVEATLLHHIAVRQAIVFGLESARRNEEVAACVVTEQVIPEAELLDFCRERLSGWQVPKRIFFVEEIPVNERGKTSRRDLARTFGGRGR
jgi:long-chain acyl-CoA synthetase